MMEVENFKHIDPAKAMDVLIENTHDLAKDGYLAEIIYEAIEDEHPNLHNLLVGLAENEIFGRGYLRNPVFLKSIAIAHIAADAPPHEYLADFDESVIYHTAYATLIGHAMQTAEALIYYMTERALDELARRMQIDYDDIQHQEATSYYL